MYKDDPLFQQLVALDFAKTELYCLANDKALQHMLSYADLNYSYAHEKIFLPCAKDYQDLENHVVISAHDNVEVKYALSKWLGTNFYYCPEGCSLVEDWIFYDMEKTHA